MAILMDSRDLILLLIGLIIGLVAWLLKELWALHKRLERDVNDLQKRLPVEFASRIDMKETESRLNTKFDKLETTIIDRIEDLSKRISAWFIDISGKLDRKADKE